MEAIAEAATRPTMRFVALKTEAQLDVQVLHRVRDRLVGQRTSLMNQMRSILLERGTMVPQGRGGLLDALAVLSEEGSVSGIGLRVRLLLDDMLDQWRAPDDRIKALDDEFAEMARSDPAARRLATIPGIGVMNATALVAAVGDGCTFSRGRDLSVWLGLVPRQATTRWQAEAAWDHQAREQILAQADHPGHPCGPAFTGQDGDAAGRLVAWPAGAGARQHGRRGAGEQAGADRVGAAADRGRVRRRRAGGGIGRDGIGWR